MADFCTAVSTDFLTIAGIVIASAFGLYGLGHDLRGKNGRLTRVGKMVCIGLLVGAGLSVATRIAEIRSRTPDRGDYLLEGAVFSTTVLLALDDPRLANDVRVSYEEEECDYETRPLDEIRMNRCDVVVYDGYDVEKLAGFFSPCDVEGGYMTYFDTQKFIAEGWEQKDSDGERDDDLLGLLNSLAIEIVPQTDPPRDGFRIHLADFAPWMKISNSGCELALVIDKAPLFEIEPAWVNDFGRSSLVDIRGRPVEIRLFTMEGYGLCDMKTGDEEWISSNCEDVELPPLRLPEFQLSFPHGANLNTPRALPASNGTFEIDVPDNLEALF